MSQVAANWVALTPSYGIRLAHKVLPVWVVEYPATNVQATHFQGYIATGRLIKDRHPALGGVDNRRIGTEHGFPTAQEAMTAAIAKATGEQA